ncbi:BglG family transcription antiterminator [Oceanobacillus kapialis]|uniref:BglG family transcription antiterminator n=1 Tax=Oceanobacillus kapialis TaxID=481353 RepID=A0ABW5Q3F4_9BACI
MHARHEKILQLLLSATQAITSQEISTELQVSSKTVRNDLKDLHSLLSHYNVHIISTRGKGYEIRSIDKSRAAMVIKEQKSHTAPTEPEDRVHFLIEKLLMQTTYIKLEELADELFVSRSSLQGDLRQVRKILQDYQLTLEQKPNYGIKVVGDEMQIRFCIAEWLYQQEPSILRESVDQSILPQAEMQIIRNSILSNLRKSHILISDISLHNLITHVAIAIRRLQENQAIQSNLDDEDLQEEKAYKVARVILQDIANALSISFPKKEVAYLAMHLLGTRLNSAEEKTNDLIYRMDATVIELVGKMVERIDFHYGIDLKTDKELHVALALHLKPAISRYYYQMNSRNPMLDEIKRNYPLSFEAALIGSEVLVEEQGIKLAEDEIAYLALHIEVAQERRKQAASRKETCLIVCASGMGSAQLLKFKLRDLIGEEVEIAGTTEMYNLKYESLDGVDFIITTIPLGWDPGIPVIQISTILGKTDISTIEGAIKRRNTGMEKYFLKAFSYFREEFHSPKAILRFLCEELKQSGMVDERYFHSVLKREEYASTSFGNLVAIPHPLEPMSTGTFLSIMTLSKPIVWGDKPVQLIFLLNASKNRKQELRPMFEALGNLLDDKDLIRRVIACRNFAEFKEVLGSR